MGDKSSHKFIFYRVDFFILLMTVMRVAPKAQRMTTRTAVLSQSKAQEPQPVFEKPLLWMAVALRAGLRQLRFLHGIEVAIIGGLFLWLVTFRHRLDKRLNGESPCWTMSVDEDSRFPCAPTPNQPHDEVL